VAVIALVADTALEEAIVLVALSVEDLTAPLAEVAPLAAVDERAVEASLATTVLGALRLGHSAPLAGTGALGRRVEGAKARSVAQARLVVEGHTRSHTRLTLTAVEQHPHATMAALATIVITGTDPHGTTIRPFILRSTISPRTIIMVTICPAG
jgi:hypothetical protein